MASSRHVQGVRRRRKNASTKAVDGSGGRQSQIRSVLNNLGCRTLREVRTYPGLLHLSLTRFGSPIFGRIERNSLSICAGWLFSIRQPFSSCAITQLYPWKCSGYCFDSKLNLVHPYGKPHSSVFTKLRISCATSSTCASSITWPPSEHEHIPATSGRGS